MNQCAIALGSNLGDSRQILENAITTLAQNEKITILSVSHWYQTKAIGPVQPDYLNGCAIIKTSLNPHSLLETLLNIEDKFGRIRKERWGARTLDLDLILYEDLILNTPNLQIPHPRMKERGFVLVPLAEIAPNWVEPVSLLTISELKNKMSKL